MKEFNFYGETWFWRGRKRFDYFVTIDEDNVLISKIKTSSIHKKNQMIEFSKRNVIKAERKRKVMRPVWFWIRIIFGLMVAASALMGAIGAEALFAGIVLILFGYLDDYRPMIKISLNDGTKHILYCDEKETAQLLISELLAR